MPKGKFTTSYNKQCNQCGKDFYSTFSTAKYCSNACKCRRYYPQTKLKINVWKRAITTIKSRSNTSLTPEDLQFMYMFQGGKCALTGFPLIKVVGEGTGLNRNTLRNISVDRIDQSLGYDLHNVRLVCYQANMMRSVLTDEELYMWCHAITTNLEKEAKRKQAVARKKK